MAHIFRGQAPALIEQTTDLDAAWADALAALPAGWGLVLSSSDGMNDAYATNPVASRIWEVAGTGLTPVDALLDLVAALAKRAAA